MIRLLDEVHTLAGVGVLLFAENDHELLRPGMRLRDARGQVHTIASVDQRDEIILLLIRDGDSAYFERLFRDVRVDATAFQPVEDATAPAQGKTEEE